MANRIRRLDDRTALALRGSHTISTVARAGEELVLNSLHSGATSITVTLLQGGVDFHVTDNGPGIDGAALRDHVGTDYCSAAGRGESLLSLSNLSRDMEIETRRGRGKELVRFRKVFREGEAVSFESSLDGNSHDSIISPSHLMAPQHTGTSITIRGVSTTCTALLQNNPQSQSHRTRIPAFPEARRSAQALRIARGRPVGEPRQSDACHARPGAFESTRGV